MTAADGAGSVAGGGRIELALGFLFAIALNLPYFDARIVGINDTFYNFANFQIFYSEFFFHGDLARWYPYGTYGLQADYEQIASLSPFGYLAGALGALLRVPDALLLFKLAVLGEQLAFVFGVWRLARRLFATPATVLVLTLAAAGTTVWYAQQWWDLRIYALLPLLLSFLFAFVERRRARDLWLAGLIGVVWCLGSIPYWIPVWLLMLGVIGAVAVSDWRATLRALVTQTPRELALLGLFLLAAGAYAWFVLHALDGTMLRAIERKLGGEVNPEQFVKYGGKANLVVVMNALLFGWPLHLPWGSGADNSVYLGLVPVLGLAIALARERSRLFLALMAGAGVLVWLALGGAFTRLVYYLPGFAYYRHVSLTFGLVKVLLLIASGYGLDRLFAKGGPRLARPALWLIATVIAVEILIATPQPFGLKPIRLLEQWSSHVFLRLGIYGGLLAACSIITRLPRQAALALGLVLDLALYQLAVYQLRVPKINDATLLGATAVRAPHFQVDRRDLPVDPVHPDTDDEANRASGRAVELARRNGSRDLYWYVYQFAQFDPCRGAWRTDYFQVGVDRLLGLGRVKGAHLDALLACGAPKLRVVADALVVGSLHEARDRVREATRAAQPGPAVIQFVAGSEAPPPSSAAATPAGRVDVLRFTLGELVAHVEVDAPDGAWLVYHDAFHAGWRAAVDGAETPVHVANLAWKAVRVPPGKSQVRFWFQHGANHALGSAIALFGLASGAGLVGWMVASLVPTRRTGPTPRVPSEG